MLGARTTLSSMVEVLVLVLSSMMVEAAGALVVDTARGSSGHEDRPSSQLPDADSARAGCLPMGLVCCESIYWRPNKHTEKETGGCDLDWHFLSVLLSGSPARLSLTSTASSRADKLEVYSLFPI